MANREQEFLQIVSSGHHTLIRHTLAPFMFYETPIEVLVQWIYIFTNRVSYLGSLLPGNRTIWVFITWEWAHFGYFLPGSGNKFHAVRVKFRTGNVSQDPIVNVLAPWEFDGI